MRIIAWVGLVVCASLTGCAVKPTTITASPDGVFVTVNGQGVGNAPAVYTFDFGKQPTFQVKGTKTGFFDEDVVVTPETPGVREGQLRLALQKDPAYSETTVTNANNTWLRIQVTPTLKPETMWQSLIDSVTGRYSSLEQLDNASGYVRSVSISKTYKSPSRGSFTIRTQFMGAIASKEPLVYKVRIQSEISETPGQWTPYDRVFKEDAQLIEELQTRLGLK